MASEARVHPLDGVRMGPKLHPAPAFPQVEQQFAPSCYVRVPDSPLMQPGNAPFENRRQNWAIGPGWVVAHRMVAYNLNAQGVVAGLWTPPTALQSFVDVQLEINSHDQRYTNSEARAWHSIALGHLPEQGWVPWLVRVKPGDVWSWSYRYRGIVTPDVRVEIALQFVLDSDLAYPIGTHKANPQGSVALARSMPTRWLTPPPPYTVIGPASQSAPRRMDFQMGAGSIVAWSGSAFRQESAEVITEDAGPHVDSSVEVSASFNDGEHLVTNGSGPDWLSLFILFGGRGGRRWQPLCRRVSWDDTLAVSFRNVSQAGGSDVPIQPEVSFGWNREIDPSVGG